MQSNMRISMSCVYINDIYSVSFSASRRIHEVDWSMFFFLHFGKIFYSRSARAHLKRLIKQQTKHTIGRLIAKKNRSENGKKREREWEHQHQKQQQ